MHKRFLFFSLLCLPLLLSGCSTRPDSEIPAAPEPAAPVISLSDGAVPGDEAEVTASDGLSGSYYNDYLGMTLSLDGSGVCALSGNGTDLTGTYAVSPDGLTLDFGDRHETACCDAHGNISIEGRTGWFLRDWVLWGITETEAGTPIPTAAADSTETLQNSDGTRRHRDFDRQIALTYADGMEVLPGRLADAVTVTDGNGAYVTGCNVTETLNAFSGNAEQYLSSHIEHCTIPEFETLYGAAPEVHEQLVFSDSTDGRLAAATLRLSNADHDISVSLILYTSAYADGTVNYICKTFFVPASDSARQSELSAAVTDLGAVRKK